MSTQSAASAVATSRSAQLPPQPSMTVEELNRALADTELVTVRAALAESRAIKLCETLASDPSSRGGDRAVRTYWQGTLADGRDLHKRFPQHNNFLRNVDWHAQRAQATLSPQHFRKQCADATK